MTSVRAFRLFGFCGTSGDVSTIRQRAAGLGPDTAGINFESNLDSPLLTARAIVARNTPSLSHAQTPDGSFIVIDGRLLEPHLALSDALQGWITNGVSAFTQYRFHGLIAAWNGTTREFVLIRDPFGVTPVYFAKVDGGLMFSSDLATLVHFGVDPTVDPVALDIYIATGYFPAPLTPLRSITKLPPGHSLTIATNGVAESSSWFQHEEKEAIDETAAVDLMEGRLRESLERTWPGDNNTGLLLSGGVDSALLLAGITRMLKKPVRAFTFRYKDYNGKLNEGGNARAIANHLGVTHEEISIGPDDVLNDLESAVVAHDEPFTWGLHSYRMRPIADRGITAVYSGAGADGWGLSRRHRAATRFNNLPGLVRGSLRAVVRAARPLNLGSQTQAEWLTEPISSVGSLYSPDADWNRALRRRIYHDPSLVDRGSQRLSDIYQSAADEQTTSSDERTLILLDKRFNTADTVLLWNRGWTVGSEMDLILPYFDHDLVDLAMNIKGATTGKDILRRVGAKYLSNDMANAPKIPQTMPVSQWVRGPLAEPFRERLADMPSAMTSVVDPSRVTQLIDEHVQGRADHAWRLVALLTAAVWFDRHSP